eukprot:7270424-Pyramimonas_sp.AAC.1
MHTCARMLSVNALLRRVPAHRRKLLPAANSNGGTDISWRVVTKGRPRVGYASLSYVMEHAAAATVKSMPLCMTQPFASQSARAQSACVEKKVIAAEAIMAPRTYVGSN